MTEQPGSEFEGESRADTVDVGRYCRRVEEHLARVNGGHLIRIVGPGFELVRTWAIEGIPLSVVFQGISQKAERHRQGRARRPLRLEFCEADVRAVYDGWQRAVGLHSRTTAAAASADPPPASGAPDSPRRASLGRHLERAIERLGRAAGRMDLPETFRDELTGFLQAVVAEREAARQARGPAREELLARLERLDRRLIEAARQAVGESEVVRLAEEAGADLVAYRARLTDEAWQRSVGLAVDRLIRDRLGLPRLVR